MMAEREKTKSKKNKLVKVVFILTPYSKTFAIPAAAGLRMIISR